MRKAFKFRIYPTKTQKRVLALLLIAACRLYNAALEQRRTVWSSRRQSLNYYDQSRQLKEVRDAEPELAVLNFSACQAVLRRLQRSFDAFFRRIKSGGAPGFPRFKSADRFSSITFPSLGDGCQVKGGQLYIQNVGFLKVKFHREILGTIKTLCLRRDAGKWYAIFSCEDVPAGEFPKSDSAIGIDVGLESFATFSTGEKIDNPRWYRKIQERLITAQRRFSHGKSRRARKVMTRLHAKAANQRLDFQHKLAHRIVCENKLIAVEDLEIMRMIADSPTGLNKSIHDAAWGQFLNILSGKAAEAGRAFVRVPPGGTSSTCYQCGRFRKKSLSERIHACLCGLVLDRDIHASLNILRLGLSLQATA